MQVENRLLFLGLWWKELDDADAERLMLGLDGLEGRRASTSGARRTIGKCRDSPRRSAALPARPAPAAAAHLARGERADRESERRRRYRWGADRLFDPHQPARIHLEGRVADPRRPDVVRALAGGERAGCRLRRVLSRVLARGDAARSALRPSGARLAQRKRHPAQVPLAAHGAQRRQRRARPGGRGAARRVCRRGAGLPALLPMEGPPAERVDGKRTPSPRRPLRPDPVSRVIGRRVDPFRSRGGAGPRHLPSLRSGARCGGRAGVHHRPPRQRSAQGEKGRRLLRHDHARAWCPGCW